MARKQLTIKSNKVIQKKIKKGSNTAQNEPLPFLKITFKVNESFNGIEKEFIAQKKISFYCHSLFFIANLNFLKIFNDEDWS